MGTHPCAQADYETRLSAYSTLLPALWVTMDRRQALPLLLTCHHDLRNAEDLALRQAAATVSGTPAPGPITTDAPAGAVLARTGFRSWASRKLGSWSTA